MAYGTGDVRAEVAAAGATVVAKVPPHANAGRFGKHDFTVDLSDPDRPPATCPAGVVATEVRGNHQVRVPPPRGEPARASSGAQYST